MSFGICDKPSVKGIIRIGGAFLVSAIVLAGAFMLREQEVHEEATISVVAAPTREYIRVADADADGIKDWEEELQKQLINDLTDPLIFSATNSVYTKPETLTGQFAESFFEKFMSTQMSNDTSTESQEAYINESINTLGKIATIPPLDRGDITVVENSLTAMRTYGNAVADAVVKNTSGDTSEAAIMYRALQTKDKAILNEIASIRESYERILIETRDVPVPSILVQQHLDFLNAYQALQINAQAMEGVFYDPLFVMVRLQNYEQDVINRYNAFVEIQKVFDANEVFFTEEETGILFSLF